MGDTVYVRDDTRTSKLDPRLEGPFTVSAVRGTDAVTVTDAVGDELP